MISLDGPRDSYGRAEAYTAQGAAPGSTYAWSASGPHPVSVSPPDQQSTVVAFTGIGLYTVNCTVTEPGPVVTVLSLDVDVHLTAREIRASKAGPHDLVEVQQGTSVHFPLTTHDQFGGPHPHHARADQRFGEVRHDGDRICAASAAKLGDHRVTYGCGNAQLVITVRVKR